MAGIRGHEALEDVLEAVLPYDDVGVARSDALELGMAIGDDMVERM